MFGDDLDPHEVSAALGAPPTESHRKGDVIHAGGGTRIAHTGSWHLRSLLAPESELEEHVLSVLTQLTSDPSVWAGLIRRFRVDLFCGVFLEHSNEGFSLSPELAAALGTRGLTIGFDIYSPDPAGQE
jgi:hypothetical protein